MKLGFINTHLTGPGSASAKRGKHPSAKKIKVRRLRLFYTGKDIFGSLVHWCDPQTMHRLRHANSQAHLEQPSKNIRGCHCPPQGIRMHTNIGEPRIQVNPLILQLKHLSHKQVNNFPETVRARTGIRFHVSQFQAQRRDEETSTFFFFLLVLTGFALGVLVSQDLKKAGIYKED